MMEPKFHPGERVELAKRPFVNGPGPFEIVRQMPADEPEPRYRIRDTVDKHERVVAEHELRPLGRTGLP
jgi:hypothetical protein